MTAAWLPARRPVDRYDPETGGHLGADEVLRQLVAALPRGYHLLILNKLAPRTMRLAAVRVAAEREMPRALRHQADLRQLMKTAPGSLFGVVAARQDLWRLAHMAIHLRQGVAAMQAALGDLDRKPIKKAGALLRRRLTRGLIAYARASQRVSDYDRHMMVVARKAALLAIGKRATAQAASLGQLEADGGTTHTVIRSGVVKPLADLVLDWGQLETWPRRELSRATPAAAAPIGSAAP